MNKHEQRAREFLAQFHWVHHSVRAALLPALAAEFEAVERQQREADARVCERAVGLGDDLRVRAQQTEICAAAIREGGR